MPRYFAICILLLGSSVWAADQPAKPLDDKIKEIAGTSEFLRGVPKRFATLQAVDVAKRQVTLLIEGESLAKVWPLVPDAEIKLSGWWGRLDQFQLGDRVWIWFKTDRNKQPVAIAMLADELSEQDMHGPGVKIVVREAGTLTLKPVKGTNRAVKTEKAVVVRLQTRTDGPAGLEGFRVGDAVYTQSAGDRARLVLDSAAFEHRRAEQKQALRKRWLDEGLPSTAAFLHTFSGEMDLMLDHETMRWARSLKPGDKVTLVATPPINALVKQVTPWRERTQVRLVVYSFDLADLTLGQRLHLKMTPPAAEVDSSQMPPDLDRKRTKQERIDWFLASIYCSCSIPGDGCTGMFYTLASCNPNGCGMPSQLRQVIAEQIDKGKTDKQIFEQLLKMSGPDLLRPHLMP